MEKEEIDRIIEGVVGRLMPILEEIRNSGGFIKDVVSVVTTERKVQHRESIATSFDPSLYE